MIDIPTIQTIIGTVLTVSISIVLLHASIEDLRRITIGSLHVILLYILVAFHSVILGNLSTQTTYVFLFGFIMFMSIAVFSRGHFGIGDAMVIGALSWYIGTFSQFQSFLFAIALVSVPWAIYWMIRYRSDNTFTGLFTGFKKEVTINNVKIGDVLATDNFMQGLTQQGIDKLRQDGYLTVCIKKPFPFIPVIFIAFIIIVIL